MGLHIKDKNDNWICYRTDLTLEQAATQYLDGETFETSSDPLKYISIDTLKANKKNAIENAAKEKIKDVGGDIIAGVFNVMKAAKILNKNRKGNATQDELDMLDALEIQADTIESIQAQASAMIFEVYALTNKQAVQEYEINFTE